MKIYFAGAIRGGREDAEFYFNIIHYLERFGVVLTEHVGSTELSEKGVSVRVIQELARHSSMQTTQRYIDISVPKLKNAVDLIGV